ncbi:hypothetical protein Y032_0017g3434 [Ancylostoma ceylanicum]|uniref:Uncharacterized protein n=1 Tax=Ancylostoma ceylanicum TaxID=53326 RepID=A0A016V6H5_9BILA|nr:hypothetical protein Y032_0017g3434 [Ancylostoma ceylanicum]
MVPSYFSYFLQKLGWKQQAHVKIDGVEPPDRFRRNSSDPPCLISSALRCPISSFVRQNSSGNENQQLCPHL